MNACSFRLNLYAALLDRFLGCDVSVLHKGVCFSDQVLGEIIGRVEVFDLASDLNRQFRGVKGLDGVNARFALRNVFPILFDADTNRCNGAHAGDHNFFHVTHNSLQIG